MKDVLRLELHNDTAVITIENPEILNGIDRTNLFRFPDLVKRATAEGATYLVIRGGGGIFCGGGSPAFLRELSLLPEDERLKLFDSGQNWVRALRASSCLTVAAVDGLAAGAGFDLMLACDAIYLGATARLNFWFGKIGAVPDLGGLALLAERVGRVRALEIYATSATMRPELAERIGIGETCSVLPDSAEQWSRFLRRRRPITRTAYAAAKRSLVKTPMLDEHLSMVAQEQTRLFADPNFQKRLELVQVMQIALHGKKGAAV